MVSTFQAPSAARTVTWRLYELEPLAFCAPEEMSKRVTCSWRQSSSTTESSDASTTRGLVVTVLSAYSLPDRSPATTSREPERASPLKYCSRPASCGSGGRWPSRSDRYVCPSW
jgi:hypothetical protein